MRWILLQSVSVQDHKNIHVGQQLHQNLMKRAPQFSVSSGPYLREKSKVLHYAGAFLVEYSDSQKGHAGAQILEGQVEASAFGQRPETPNFCVHLH